MKKKGEGDDSEDESDEEEYESEYDSDEDEVSVVSAPAVSSELLAAAPSAAARDARWSQTRWCVSKETEFAVDSTESTDEVLGRETGQGDASASSTTTMAYDASLYATTEKNCHFPPTEAPPPALG